jgi:hypothetical protein
MADTDEPETELGQTHKAPETPTAWSDHDDATPLEWPVDVDDVDDDTLLYDDFDEDPADDRSTTFWLRLYVATLTVVAVVLGALLWWVLAHHDAPATPPVAAVAVPSSPDDKVVPPPVAAVPPPAPPVEEDDAYVATAVSLKPNTHAAAWATDSSDDRARELALNYCNAKFGGDADCVIAQSVHHGCVAVAWNNAGTFAWGRGPDGPSALAAAKAELADSTWITPAHCSK